MPLTHKARRHCWRAAGNGHADVVALLLKNGADAAHAATSGATALSAAVIARKADVVAALAAHGVDIDQRLKGGGTALMIAAALGYPETVMALLEAGANVDASDDSHTRTLHAAAHLPFMVAMVTVPRRCLIHCSKAVRRSMHEIPKAKPRCCFCWARTRKPVLHPTRKCYSR